jgi:hypothetical protein
MLEDKDFQLHQDFQLYQELIENIINSR